MGGLNITAQNNTIASVEIPIKQHFKPYGLYNLKIKYMAGEITFEKGTIPLKISIINKDTNESKTIIVDHTCSQNIPMRNVLGKNFNVKDGKIALTVEVDTTSSSTSKLNNVMMLVVIEDSNYPIVDFPKREVEYTDFYIQSPLYSVFTKDDNVPSELKDELCDELDLKSGTIKRYVKKQTINASDLVQNPHFNYYMYMGPNQTGLNTNSEEVLDRPSLGVISPKNPSGSMGQIMNSGAMLTFSKEEIGEFGTEDSACPFTIFYTLRVPKTESFNSVNIPIRKGLNVIDVEGDFNCRSAVLKI
jgi:hypothetical protein